MKPGLISGLDQDGMARAGTARGGTGIPGFGSGPFCPRMGSSIAPLDGDSIRPFGSIDRLSFTVDIGVAGPTASTTSTGLMGTALNRGEVFMVAAAFRVLGVVRFTANAARHQRSLELYRVV